VTITVSRKPKANIEIMQYQLWIVNPKYWSARKL